MRPELYIATVLHARCLLRWSLRSQFSTSGSISCASPVAIWVSLRMKLFFDLFYLVVKLVPFLLWLQGGLIHFRSVFLYHLDPPMHHQHVICIERGSCLISRTFCGRRWDRDPVRFVVQAHVSSHWVLEICSICGWTPPASHHSHTWGWYDSLLYESYPRRENTLNSQQAVSRSHASPSPSPRPFSKLKFLPTQWCVGVFLSCEY